MADPESPHSSSPRELTQVLEAVHRGDPFVLYRGPDGSQQLVHLEEGGEPITLGRSVSADVSITWDSEISTLHCELQRVSGEWLVVDDGLSSNGTYLNGHRVAGRRRLRDSDRLRLGRTTLVFREPAGRPEPSTVVAGSTGDPRDLTGTQRRVLTALCRPYREQAGFAAPATNQQVADEVFLSVDAVKAHLRTLFHKFELNHLPQNEKRARLAESALESGVVSPRDL